MNLLFSFLFLKTAGIYLVTSNHMVFDQQPYGIRVATIWYSEGVNNVSSMKSGEHLISAGVSRRSSFLPLLSVLSEDQSASSVKTALRHQ